MPKTFLVPMFVPGTTVAEVILDDDDLKNAEENGIDPREMAMDNACADVTLCHQCAHKLSFGDPEIGDDLTLEDVTEKGKS